MVTNEARQHADSSKPVKINVDIMLDILKSNKARALDVKVLKCRFFPSLRDRSFRP